MLRPEARTVIHVPVRAARTPLRLALHALAGAVLTPLYWLLAALRSAPGLRLALRSAGFGLRGLVAPRRLPLRTVFHLLFMPMESTRYFEFDFVWRALEGRTLHRYLDVSSPRLLPLALLDRRPRLEGELINPNPADLAETRRAVEALGLAARCRLHGCLIADAAFEPGTFDAITSISVLEHIPDDQQAVRRIWDLLEPGGVFVLTVPCMARAQDQFIDRDEFGLLPRDAQGHVFWQRMYDRDALERRVFAVTGAPREMRVFGETVAGAHARNNDRKRGDPGYPYWREALMMAVEWRAFERIEDLPGEGVVGLVFEKPR